jgi:hypothetical protein
MVLSLPFMTENGGNNQEIPLSKESETGLIIALAESKREKGGGFLRKKENEKISAISKFYWPLYLAKNADEHQYILFDMLAYFNHTCSYETIENPSVILHELRDFEPHPNDIDTYIASLKSHENSFKNFAGMVDTTLTGCFPDDNLLKELKSFISHSNDTEIDESVVFSSHISTDQITKNLNSLKDLKTKSLEDIESLTEIRDSFLEKQSEWNIHISEKQSEMIAYFNDEIETIRPDVEMKVAEYRSRMNAEIQSLELRFSPLISNLQAEVARWKREEDMYKRLGDSHKRQKDSVKKSKKEAEKQLKRTENEYHDEVKNTKNHYGNLIEEEWDRIHSLERRRDQGVKELQQKKEEIQKWTGKIEQRIKKLIDKKNGFMDDLDAIGMSVTDIDLLADHDDTFLYLPVYAVQYQSDSRARTLIFPPLKKCNAKNMVNTLKGFLGGVTLPLEPRSKELEKRMIKTLQEHTETDETRGNELCEKCTAGNIMGGENVKEIYFSVLKELKDGGWIKDKHYNEFCSSFEKQILSS